MDTFSFPAIVKRHGLSTKKQRVVIAVGMTEEPHVEIVDVPCVTITLEFTAAIAREINAKLSAYQGSEVMLVLEGNAEQMNLHG